MKFRLGDSFLRLSIFGLAIVVFGALRFSQGGVALAALTGNTSASTARALTVNTLTGDSLGASRTEVWYRTRLSTNRAYQISAWTVGEDGASVVTPLAISVFSDAAGTVPASPAPTVVSGDLEGSPNGIPDVTLSATFQPATSGVYRIRVTGSPAATATLLNVIVRETTLFSPWFSASTSGGQYQAFHEIHNNTAQSVIVTLKAFGSAGTQIGSHQFTMAANATAVKTATGDLGVAGAAPTGGTLLIHNGAFGAISANTTTLSNVTGLSFDSPFTPRSSSTQAAPVRKIPSVPPVVTTGTASAITKTTASVAGTVNPNGFVTTVSFDYGLTASYGSTMAATPGTVGPSGGNTSVSANLSALTCGSTYHFRAKGVSVQGTVSGSDQTFATLSCAAAAPTATTTAASGLGLTSATLNGTVNDNLATTTVSFDFGPTASYGTTMAAVPATVASGAGSTAVSFNVTGLFCGSTYHFRVKAVNILGTTLGSDVAFTTSACTVAPTITTGASSTITKTTASVAGTANGNGAATTVAFEYGPTTGYGASMAATPGTVGPAGGSTSVSANLSGLACGSTYHFRATGTSSAGTTNGADQSFDTLSCAAAAPTATTTGASGLGLTTATLNGTVNDNFASTTVSFDYGLTASYGTTVAAVPATLAAGAGNTAVSFNVTGLSCSSTYHFRVKAVNILGTTLGTDLSFTTSACTSFTNHPRLWLAEPSTMSRLTAAAAANSTEWQRLKSFCDTRTTVSLGAEYQGLEAYRYIANFSLCYRIVLANSGAAAAAPYAQKAMNVLQDTQSDSEPTGKQPVLTFSRYCTDSGFGIRAFVPSLAIAYDWLFDSPLMTAGVKSQIIAKINNWLGWYASGVPASSPTCPGGATQGYLSSDYISNYNAGYVTSSVLAAIAINGEDASAPAMMTGALNRFNAAHTLFDQKMTGGHWPEGWNYGPLVFQSHLMAGYALKTFTGTASHVIGKQWMSNNVPFKLQAMTPDGKFFYDDGLWSGNGYGDVRYNDIAAAGLAYGWSSANGALAKLYIDKALAAVPPASLVDEQWKGFLLYDPTAAAASTVGLPRSHFAQGLGHVMMRSDWTATNATWAGIASGGPYLSVQGEQDKDQGHIALYKTASLLLDVNHDLYTDAATHNSLMHNTFTMDGRTDGTVAQGGVDYPPAPFQGTQTSFSQECLTPPGGASTPIGNNAFNDAGEYLFSSGEFSAAYQTNPLNFPDPCGRVPVNWMNRSVFYLRPDVFVVYDQIRKRTTGAGGSQAAMTPTQHWHFPTGATTSDSNRRVAVDAVGGRLHFQTVFPAAATSTMVNEARNTTSPGYPGVANSHLSVRYPGNPSPYQNFLTVMRAGLANASYVAPTVAGITGTNAFGTLISGLLPAESATPIVVVFADNGNPPTIPTSISYQYTSAGTNRNYVMKLKPNQTYSVVTSGSGTITVTITESVAGTTTDSAGVLVFNQ